MKEGLLFGRLIRPLPCGSDIIIYFTNSNCPLRDSEDFSYRSAFSKLQMFMWKPLSCGISSQNVRKKFEQRISC
jgi:hypothetical protein